MLGRDMNMSVMEERRRPPLGGEGGVRSDMVDGLIELAFFLRREISCRWRPGVRESWDKVVVTVFEDVR